MLPVDTTLEALRERRPMQLIYDFEAVIVKMCKIREEFNKEYKQLDDLSDRITQVIKENMEGCELND